MASDVRVRAAPDMSDPIETILLDDELVAPEALGRARLVQAETGEPLDSVLTRLGLVSEQRLAERFAQASALPLAPAGALAAASATTSALSPEFLRAHRVVTLAQDDASVTAAFANPFDDYAADALAFALERPVRRLVAPASDIEAAIERRYGAAAIETAAAEIDEDDLERLKDFASDAPVIRMVNRLIARAVELRASDIHVEPTEDQLVIRFRIDGVMREMDPLPAAMRAPLVSRIKIMAGLNIAEKRLPQDGRLRLAIRGSDVDLRVASSPTIHGEAMVLRLLDRSGLVLDLGALGFDAPLVAAFGSAVHQPHGMVLVTGPTGSGKTTTLYAALAELNRPERKILTIEDPIEYRLAGISQTQVQPAIGLNFATALRSFLRQDPDVMMVGEIRDLETAQVAVQAALTGHMILSTLHTNTAASAVTRLIDMGVEPFLITSTLNGVLAQRLARRLCEHCRVPYRPDAELLAPLGVQLAPEALLYRAGGCATCAGSGYRGRIALLEFLAVDDTVAHLILDRAGGHELERAAAAAGGRAMREDGLAKACAGLTTIEEVLRILRDG